MSETTPDFEISMEEDIQAISALAPYPGGVFAASGQGLQRSDDQGQTWVDALLALRLAAGVPVYCLATSGDLVFAGGPLGVLQTPDRGASWGFADLPAPAPIVSALAVSPDYNEDATVFAATLEDGVLVSQDFGVHWVAWNLGLLDPNVLCLAISPDFPRDQTLYAGTGTGLFRSRDAGKSWQAVDLPFGFDAVLSLAISSHDTRSHTLYLGSEEQGLWVSLDDGDSWQRAAPDLIIEPVNSLLLFEDGVLAVTGSGLWHGSRAQGIWTNRLPAVYAGRELSAVAHVMGHGSHAAEMIGGFSDGAVAWFRLV